jgi:hypothetical protein
LAKATYFPAGQGPDGVFREKESFMGIWTAAPNTWFEIENPYEAFTFESRSFEDGSRFKWAGERFLKYLMREENIGKVCTVPKGDRDVAEGEDGDTDIVNPFYGHENPSCFMLSLATAVNDAEFGEHILTHDFMDQKGEAHALLKKVGYRFCDMTAVLCSPEDKDKKVKTSLLDGALDENVSKDWGMHIAVPISKVGDDQSHAICIDFGKRLIHDNFVKHAYKLTLENLGMCVPGSDGIKGFAKLYQVQLFSSKKRKRATM